MCSLRSLVLLGLLSLTALVGAKLRWKCELFDTSRESSTRTTFVDFIHNKPPAPNNPRITRSTNQKCRPRPKKTPAGDSVAVEKLAVQQEKAVVQQDAPGNASPGDDYVPGVKYQRKKTKESTDLNIGPGFERSEDPYGRSKEPVPRIFRPAELKGADQLSKPLTEHLDENIMPDFEFDDDNNPQSEEDLPWCPEEDDCETADLTQLTQTQLVELKQRCETTITPDRLKQIESLMLTESPIPIEAVVPTTDRSDALPPTGTTNCTQQPSGLSEETLAKYRKECPCEKDTSLMDKTQLEEFKKTCLVVIMIPGKPRMRKNGRCAELQKNIEKMSDAEYDVFVKDCLVGPKNITLRKILVINRGPQCEGLDKMGKEQFVNFREKCTTMKTCDDIVVETLSDDKLNEYKKLCSPTRRKTIDLCQTENVDDLTDRQFEDYKTKCLFQESGCESIDADSLSDEEYEKFKEDCIPMNCDGVKPEELSKKQKNKYEVDCLPSAPSISSRSNCSKVDVELLDKKQYALHKKNCRVETSIICEKASSEQMNKLKFQKFLFECSDLETCETLNLDAMDQRRRSQYEKECQSVKEYCESTQQKDLEGVELEEYIRLCNPVECEEVEDDVWIDGKRKRKISQKKMSKFEKNCLREDAECTDVDINEFGRTEFMKFMEKCRKINCFDSPDQMSENSRKQCSNTSLICESAQPKKLSGKQFVRFKKVCISRKPECRNVTVDDMALLEKCIETGIGDFNCSDVNPKELSGPELKKYEKMCSERNPSPDCESVDIDSLSDSDYEDHQKRCAYIPEEEMVGEGCRNVNIDNMTDYQYNAYKKYCKVQFEGQDCDDVRVDKLSDRKLREYVKKCGLFCGIERKEVLEEKQRTLYEERCEGDSAQLERKCSEVQIEKLGLRMYGQFAEKCIGKIDACSLLTSPRLTRSVYNEYRLRCETRVRPTRDFNCNQTDTSNLTLEQYKEYQKMCGSSFDCTNVDIEEISEEKFVEFKRQCRPNRNHRDCKNLKIETLSRKEYKKYLEKCGPVSSEDKDKECIADGIREYGRTEYIKFVERCGYPEEVTEPDCMDTELLEKMTKEEFMEYKKRCIPSTDRTQPQDGTENRNCSSVKFEELSEKEKQEYKKKCSFRNTSDCKIVDIDKLSAGERREYLRKCGPPGMEPDVPEGIEDCDSVDVDKLSEKELEKYQKRCGDCSNVNVDSLSDNDYEDYKKRCSPKRKSPRPENCNDINIDELSDEERQKYLKRCGTNPSSPGDSITIEKEVIVNKQPKDGSVPSGNVVERNIFEDCSTVKIDRLSAKELEIYKKECGTTRKEARPDCENVDVNSLSDDELRRYKERCGAVPRSPGDSVTIEKEVVINKPPGSPDVTDCSNIDIDNLSEEEFKKYKKNCSPTRGNGRPDCDEVEVSKLSVEEFKKYTKKCGGIPSSPGDSITIDKEVVVNKPPRDGSVPPVDGNVERKTSEDCENVNVDQLTVEKLEKYKKECETTRKKSRPDCDDVDVNSLSDDELIRYKKRCGTVPRSPGDSVTIEKEVVINKPPGSPDVTDCSNIDIDNLSDEEFRRYKKNCKPGRRTGRPDCDEVEVSKLSVEEFKRYTKKCGGIPSSPGDSITIEKEVVVNKPPKDGSVPPVDVNVERKTSDDCENVNVDQLTAEELEKYKKECGTRKGSRPNCYDVDINSLSVDELRRYKKRCGTVPRSPGDSVTIEKEVVINEPPGSPDVTDCSNIDIDNLSGKEFKKYKKNCSPTRGNGRPECDEIEVSKLSVEEFKRYMKRCGIIPNSPGDSITIEKEVVVNKPPRDGSVPPVDVNVERKTSEECDNVNIDRLTVKELEYYEKECGTTRKKSRPDCDDVDVNSLSDDELRRYKKRCGPPKRRPENCENVNVNDLTEQEYRDYKRRCGTNPSSPGDSITIEKEVVVNKPPKDGSVPPVDIRKSQPDCEDIDVNTLSGRELTEYRRLCGSVTPIPADCYNVRIEELSADEYLDYKKRCKGTPEQSETVEKELIAEKPRNNGPETPADYDNGDKRIPFDCSNVKVYELLEKELKMYRRKCAPQCNDVDVKTLTKEQLAKFEKICGTIPTSPGDSITIEKEVVVNKPPGDGSVPPEDIDFDRKTFEDCEKVNSDRLTIEEFEKYKKECGTTRKEARPDCDDIDVKALSGRELREYKKKCGPANTVVSRPADCYNVRIEELSAKEYLDYKKRCKESPPEPSVTIEKEVRELWERIRHTFDL